MSFDSLLIHICDIKRYRLASVVIGTDGNDYYCKVAHLSAAVNKPITGADYADYWVATGTVGEGAVWVSGIDYVASYDVYGQPVKVWSIIFSNEPCRLVASSGREIKVGAEVVISDWKLFVDDAVIVTEQDRVDNIRLRATGLPLAITDTFEIILVQPRSDGVSEHHKELALQKVA